MLQEALRERAGRLERRLEELDRSNAGVTVRSLEIMALHLFCMFQFVIAARPRYMTCGFVWMPLSLSLVIFAAHCFHFSGELRRLRRYSAEMERVREKLSAVRRRLLEHCMDHEASLAEVGFGSTTLTWVNPACFLVTSAIITLLVIWYAICTCAAYGDR